MDAKKISTFFGIVTIIVGFVVLFMSIFLHQEFQNFLCVSIGIGVILTNIFPSIYYANQMLYSKRHIVDFIFALAGIVLGIIFLPIHNMGMCIALGVFLCVLPTVRIILSSTKLEQLKREVALYIVGVFLFLIASSATDQPIMIILGAVMIGLGVINLIMTLAPIVYKRRKRNNSIDAKVTSVEVIDE